MSSSGRRHPGARHARFSVFSAPCQRCGCRWQIRGCLSSGPKPLVELLRGEPRYRHTCACGAEVAVLLPPFVDRHSITVTPILRPASGSPDRSRPAA